MLGNAYKKGFVFIVTSVKNTVSFLLVFVHGHIVFSLSDVSCIYFIEQVPLIGNIIRVMNFPNLLFIIEKTVCHLHSEHFETWVAYPQEASRQLKQFRIKTTIYSF